MHYLLTFAEIKKNMICMKKKKIHKQKLDSDDGFLQNGTCVFTKCCHVVTALTLAIIRVCLYILKNNNLKNSLIKYVNLNIELVK